jgi:hypothetical protein
VKTTMAKILTEMPKKAGGAGRTPIYPYDEWLDGQIRELEVGEDYKARPQSVVASIRTTAERRGMKLRSRFVHNDDKEIVGIVIQAFEPDTPTEVPAEENGHKEETQTLPKSNRRPRTRSRA